MDGTYLDCTAIMNSINRIQHIFIHSFISCHLNTGKADFVFKFKVTEVYKKEEIGSCCWGIKQEEEKPYKNNGI